MFIRFMKRSAIISAGVVLAALVATGCGGAKSGAGKAATSAGGLSFVPKTAIGYVVFDTDFSGKNWDQVQNLGKKFPQYATQRAALMAQINKGTDGMTYKSDIKPWLGKDAGMALVLTGDRSKGHGIMWVKTTDDAKTVKALKKAGATGAKTYKGTKTYTSGDKSTMKSKGYFAVDNGYLVIADDKATIELALTTKKDGPSITDDKTAMDAAKHLDDGAIIAVVMGREGLKSALKAADKSSGSASASKALKQLKVDNFNGLSMGVSAKDHGFAADGWVGNGGTTKMPADAAPALLTSLPATTALALSGQDLGGGLESIISSFSKSDPKVGSQITQAEAALGLDKGALGKAFGGQFSISAAGGAMPSVALVLENQGSDTKNTIDKLVGVSQMAGVTAKQLTVKGGTGQTVTIGKVTIAAGSLKDVSIITNDPTFLTSWGTSAKLGDSDSYKRVTDEAGMPSKVGMLFYIDPKSTVALGESLSKTSIGSSLTSKLGSAAGASRSAAGKPAGSSPMGNMPMGSSGNMPMGGSTGSAAGQLAMAKQALANFGPILFWTASDGNNFEMHAFSEINDAAAAK